MTVPSPWMYPANSPDPDSDTLTYTALSSDTTKVQVSVLSSTVTITPVAQGAATVTVTADDGKGLTATQIIPVLVTGAAPNRAPVVVGTIAPVTLTAGGNATTVDVSGKFSDPDNNSLTYIVLSLDRSKARVSVAGTIVTITPLEEGTTTVRVTASDGRLTATQTIAVLVTAAPNRAPTAVGTIAPVTLTAGASPINVDVSSKFSDPDSDTLAYTAVSSNIGVGTVSVAGTTVAIIPGTEGGSNGDSDRKRWQPHRRADHRCFGDRSSQPRAGGSGDDCSRYTGRWCRSN